MIGRNFHLHTLHSDGSNAPIDYVLKAIEQGMTAIGFSDHAPMPFENSFSIQPGELGTYCNEINSLKEKYADIIELFLALEIDFIPGLMDDFDALNKQCRLDYIIGSVHLIPQPDNKLWFIDGPMIETYDNGLKSFYNNDIKKAVTAFYHQTNEMILSQHFDVIGHLDKIKMHNQNRYFLETEAWYRQLLLETLQLIHEKSLIVEVNSRGVYKKRCDDLFPSSWILIEMRKLNIPVVISSDAHHPGEIQALFPQAIDTVFRAGYNEIMIFKQGKWQPISIELLQNNKSVNAV